MSQKREATGQGRNPILPPADIQRGLQIVYRPLRELVPYVRNARTHTPAQVEKIAASLQTFGWTNSMLIAGDDMIAGHARLAAATKLAEAGLAIPRNADPWMGPTVDLSALTEGERRTYILTDNRTAEEAGWDRELLAIELEAISAIDVKLLGYTAFDPKEISTIMQGWRPDMDKIDATEAAMADMTSLIKVRCPKTVVDECLAKVRAALDGIEGVSIDQ